MWSQTCLCISLYIFIVIVYFQREEKEAKQIERPMRWIKKTELENMLEETLDDKEVWKTILQHINIVLTVIVILLTNYSWFSLIPKGIKWQRHGGHVGVPNNGR
jgi:hypothetical protein